MLRLETETGWWLVTHPDHARLAGAFAEKWGNEKFLSPEPRESVLKGIARHDDGWKVRDAAPQITRQGKPSAFSVELVGKYSAFEEIDLADYLSVRDRAVRLMAEEDAYAALLISMHTYNLLTEHADRSTIAPAQLPLLDQFLERQKALQRALRLQIIADARLNPEEENRSRGARPLQASSGDRQSFSADLRRLSAAGKSAASFAAAIRRAQSRGGEIRGRAPFCAGAVPIRGASGEVFIFGATCARKALFVVDRTARSVPRCAGGDTGSHHQRTVRTL